MLAMTSEPGEPASMQASSWKSTRGLPIAQDLTGRSYQGSKAARLQAKDFVHAIVTSHEHEYLAMETRMWRKVCDGCATGVTSFQSLGWRMHLYKILCLLR